jgi:hypothetical protein
MVKNVAGNAECQSEISCLKRGLGNALWICMAALFPVCQSGVGLFNGGKVFLYPAALCIEVNSVRKENKVGL